MDEKVVVAEIAKTTHHGPIEGKTQTKDCGNITPAERNYRRTGENEMGSTRKTFKFRLRNGWI